MDDIIVPSEKVDIVGKGQSEVDQVKANYEMGFITDKERYNQVIDGVDSRKQQPESKRNETHD